MYNFLVIPAKIAPLLGVLFAINGKERKTKGRLVVPRILFIMAGSKRHRAQCWRTEPKEQPGQNDPAHPWE